MSAVVLGTFITYFTFARYAMTDVPLVCFILGSIYFFVLSEEKGNSKRYAALSGLFFGLALMTKQIAALLIPIIIFAYALSTKKSLRFLFTKHFTLFWGVGLLLFSPWVIYMGVTFGSHFWQSYFLYSDVSRAISPVEGHAASYFFYFGSLVNSENWLWLVLLPFAAGLCIFNAVFKRLKADILVLLWMAIVLLVFRYIMPVYPAFALAISSLLYELSKKLLRKPHTGNKLMKRQLQKDIHFLN
jgi:4-amino-4-deoxy-L-arabinose transferase-like glycosyltransferase